MLTDKVIGYINGRPVFAIAGGSEDPPPDPDPDPDPNDPPPDPEPDPKPDYKAEAEKYKALMRKHEKRAKDNAEAAKKLKELEDGNKSEIQKAADKAAQAEKDAESAKAKALRYEVAIDKGVPKELMRFLNGTTEEELTEQADALLEAVKANEKEEDDARTTPKEKLRAGASGKAGGDSITDYREHVQKLAKY